VTDYTDLRNSLAGTPLEPLTGLVAALETMQATDATLGGWLKETSAEVVKLWEANAEVRDEVHAVANRLENLTAFVTSNPAEVAAKIVTDANRQTLAAVCGEPCSECGVQIEQRRDGLWYEVSDHSLHTCSDVRQGVPRG